MSPRRRLLVGVVAALVLVLAIAGGVALLLERDGAEPADQATPGAVLLVPGYGGNTRSLAQLAERIRATGRTATVVAPPGDGTGDLREQARNLRDAVDRAKDDGAPSVDIVGYSAGGVVTWLFLEEYEGVASTRRVVTLGSPLHGAKLAAAGAAFGGAACPAACRQLAPGSDVLDDVDEAPVPWLSIWTENDETVQPPDSARFDGATNVSMQSICPGVTISHSQLPVDPQVTALVLKAIGTEPVTAPTSCETA
ncbi:esterase/lipase family protein [Virgisporangium ochraceum]|uniref:esterase/lipase family protein n=1 Tax=Virgisporangium ochraceum TaxID=65505 RepID=UPI001EF323A5|nr:lipase [Virgisporangium ochraceum]